MSAADRAAQAGAASLESPSKRATLGAALDPRRNSLNALRLLLALLVIVSHAPLAGGFGHPLMVGDLELGGWAVGGFFAISGCLITGSRLRLDFRAFLWRRVLRIYPAFWVSLLAVAFLFAPLAAFTGHGSYRTTGAVGFVVKNLTLRVVQPTISGSLVGGAYHSTWNLSLWTLQWEFLCYIGIAALLSLAWVLRRRWCVLVVWVLVSTPYALTVAFHGTPSTALAQGSRLAGYFLAGAVAYLYRGLVPARAWLAGIAAVALAAFAALGVVGALGAAPIAYLCLWLGGTLPLQRIGRTNDISYGVYIYAFPVQLLLTILGVARAGLFAYTGACLLAVLPLAWVSWRLVEKPALRLKDLVPARR